MLTNSFCGKEEIKPAIVNDVIHSEMNNNENTGS